MIEFREVSKIYQNGTEALHNVNLKVEKGEFVFIVGSSGAGKSTFLKLVMCEERPTEGQIFIDGDEVTKIRKRRIPYLRRKMGIVFQDFRLIDQMTVFDNVAFAMRVVGASSKSIKKRVPYILGLVGLQHKAKHFPTELSGGEQQRVGLARALVNNPEIIVADEPTGNIDPALSFEILDLLNEINRRGTTILLVTHEHSLVKHFHKRIIQIHSGEVVADTLEVQGGGKPDYTEDEAGYDETADQDEGNAAGGNFDAVEEDDRLEMDEAAEDFSDEAYDLDDAEAAIDADGDEMDQTQWSRREGHDAVMDASAALEQIEISLSDTDHAFEDYEDLDDDHEYTEVVMEKKPKNRRDRPARSMQAASSHASEDDNRRRGRNAGKEDA